MIKPRVVVFCTVHPWNDVRIFQKQCVSLARAGLDVHFLAPGAPDETREGVQLHGCALPRVRAARMTFTATRLFLQALSLKGDVYQIHSPELLPFAFLLCAAGKPVVYDVHEDYVTLIQQKTYLPSWLRYLIACAVRLLERVASHTMTVILAEKYYARFLPNHAGIFPNYPRLTSYREFPKRDRREANILLFTGNSSEDRGALLHPKLLQASPLVEVHCVGHCPRAVAERARAIAGESASRLRLEGIDSYVPHDKIRLYYSREDLLAGIAIFPDTPDTRNKELTKLFEYMAAGLPILCSDFPAWRSLVVDHRVGLVVDPESRESIREAVNWLLSNPDARQAMGQRGRDLAQESFNWESQEQNIALLFRRLTTRDSHRKSTLMS